MQIVHGPGANDLIEEKAASPSDIAKASFQIVLVQWASQYSLWAQDLRRDGVNMSEFTIYQQFATMMEKIPSEWKQKNLQLVGKGLEVESAVWNAAVCENSKWKKQSEIPYSQDKAQNWMAMCEVFPGRDGELGGIGTANLLAMNYVLFQRFKSEALKKETEQAVKPAVLSLLKTLPHRVIRVGSTIALKLLSWNTIVEESFDAIAKQVAFDSKGKLNKSVTSVRPWTISFANTFEYQVENGWKIQLFQSFALLLAAILPIRKRILEACQISTPIPTLLVTLHTVLDTMCIVGVFLLCTMASTAFSAGALIENIIAYASPVVAEILQSMQGMSWDGFAQQQTLKLLEMLHKHGVHFLETLKSSVLPVFSWGPTFFLQCAAGSCLFLAISAGLSRVLCHKQLTTCLSVGVCGPLWLFTEDGEKIETFEATARGTCLVMISRSVLLAASIAFAWAFVNPFSVQFFFAALCNRTWDVFTLKISCFAFLAAHCVSGLVAIFAVHDVRMKQVQPVEIGGISNESCAYGTFERDHEP